MPPEPGDIVVIGASAGGVEALSELVSELHDVHDRAIFLVLHMSQPGTSALPRVLATRATIPVSFAADGAPLRHGEITVAPPGAHLILTRGATRLVVGPRENGHRPAIDPLFRSAASVFGPVTGVLLSGALDDGVAGLAAIKAAGGRALVQDPDEAVHPWMPLNAIAAVSIDKVLSIKELAREIDQGPLVEVGAGGSPLEAPGIAGVIQEDVMQGNGAGAAGDGADPIERLDAIGTSTGLTCPACGGAIWEVDTEGVPTLRCHVGHSYGVDSFSFEQSIAVESALWAAVRALDEKEALLRRLGEHAEAAGHPRSAGKFLQRARDMHRQAESVRAVARTVVVDGDASAEGSDGARPA